MRFYFFPLSSNSFLPKEKGERRCKELSEVKVPDFIRIQKKATHGKLRCQSETDEGLHQGKKENAMSEIGGQKKYYAKYSINMAKEKMEKRIRF